MQVRLVQDDFALGLANMGYESEEARRCSSFSHKRVKAFFSHLNSITPALSIASSEKLRCRSAMEDLTPGFRFYPTEEELLTFYLPHQLQGRLEDLIHRVIPVLNVYCVEPWQLPNLSGQFCRGDREQWFFFVPMQEREASGGRPSRMTATGYWKATGSITRVYSSNYRVIGLKKTMVFYRGKTPNGRKTKWKMNEYRAIEEIEMPSQSAASIPQLRHEFSLCRVYVVSGCGRAFDRRPFEDTVEHPRLGAMPETLPANRETAEASNSGDFPASNWEMDDDFEKTLLEFEEQKNWP